MAQSARVFFDMTRFTRKDVHGIGSIPHSGVLKCARGEFSYDKEATFGTHS